MKGINIVITRAVRSTSTTRELPANPFIDSRRLRRAQRHLESTNCPQQSLDCHTLYWKHSHGAQQHELANCTGKLVRNMLNIQATVWILVATASNVNSLSTTSKPIVAIIRSEEWMSPQLLANVSWRVLFCIETDVCKYNRVTTHFYIYKICALLNRSWTQIRGKTNWWNVNKLLQNHAAKLLSNDETSTITRYF